MSSLRGVHTTLATRVLIRLGWSAFAVIAANVIYAAAHNVFDANHISENIVRTETREIAQRADRALKDNSWKAGESLPHYDCDAAFRLIEPNGTVRAEWRGTLVAPAAAKEPYDARTAVFQVSRLTLDGKISSGASHATRSPTGTSWWR